MCYRSFYIEVAVFVNRQAIVAWCMYVDERRRKAALYADALDSYRYRLLVEGATKWLAVAADMSQLRMKHAAQMGAQVVVDYTMTFHCRS